MWTLWRNWQPKFRERSSHLIRFGDLSKIIQNHRSYAQFRAKKERLILSRIAFPDRYCKQLPSENSFIRLVQKM